MEELNQETKDYYMLQSTAYKALKQEVVELIDEKKRRIRSLEETLNRQKPSVPNADIDCPRCDIKSLVYVGRTPQGGAAGGDDIYECAICGYNNLLNY